MDNVFKELCEIISEQRIFRNEPMSKHTTFKIGGNADLYVKVLSTIELQEVLKIAKKHNIPIYIIGNGSNLLVKDKGINGIVIQIGMENYTIISNNKEEIIVRAEAGVKLAMLAQKLLQNEVEGFEFASGIPGTIGGAVKMNAGAYGSEMCNIIETTRYIDIKDSKIKELTNEEQKFEYRKSIFSNKKEYIILETTLKLKKGNVEEIKEKIQEYAKMRKEKQPINYPSAGSTFKRGNNYITAKLIDECGLKGYSIGGAQVSELHAGFLINKENATATDVLNLIEYVQQKVYEKFSVKIELEIEVIGKNK